MAWIYLAAIIGNRIFPSDWVAEVVLAIAFASLGITISFALDFLIDQKLSKRKPNGHG